MNIFRASFVSLLLAGCAGNSSMLAERELLHTQIQALQRENAMLVERIDTLSERVSLLTSHAAGTSAPPAASPAAAIVVPEEGWITLRTEPWCEVYLKGDLIGTTPLNHLLSPAGTYSFLLVCKPAGIEREIQVDVRSGEESTTRLRLTPE